MSSTPEKERIHLSETVNEAQPSPPQRSSRLTSPPTPPPKPNFFGLSRELNPSRAGVVIQPKLAIGQPGDRYERQADQVATQVAKQWNTSQLSHSAGQEASAGVKPALVNGSSSITSGVEASGEVATTITAARGSGRPLSQQVRQPVEHLMGMDFSGVRIHTDTRAHRLNETLGALSFTAGQDVFFKRGEYRPDSEAGKELLAHELTHVAQQGHSGTIAIQKRGLEDAKEKHQKDIDKTQAERISEVKDKISKKETSNFGKEYHKHSFEEIADLLHGLIDLQSEKGILEGLIKDRFGDDTWKQKYLTSIIENDGQPSAAMKLALALGLVTNQPSDANEVMRILEETNWSTNLQELNAAGITREIVLKRIFNKLRGSSKSEKVMRFFDLIKAQKTDTSDQIVKAELNYLDAIIDQYTPRAHHSLSKHKEVKLIDGIKGWIQIASPAARITASQDGSEFTKKINAVTSQRTAAYLVLLMEGVSGLSGVNSPIEPEDLNKPEEVWQEELNRLDPNSQYYDTDKAKIAARQENATDFGAVIDLHGLIAREKSKWQDSHFKKRVGFKTREGVKGHFKYQHRKLKAAVSEMSAKQMKLFLETLDPDPANPSTDNQIDVLSKKLEDAGLRQKEIDDALALFRGAVNYGDGFKAGDNYRALVRLVSNYNRGRGKSKFAKNALSIVTKLQGGEYQQVRDNSGVWGALERLSNGSAPEKEIGNKILAIFGQADWTDSPPQAGIESSAQHWATLIDYEIEKHSSSWAGANSFVKIGRIVQLMQQAQLAGEVHGSGADKDEKRKNFTVQSADSVYKKLKRIQLLENVSSFKELTLIRGIKGLIEKFKSGDLITAQDRLNLATVTFKPRENELAQIIKDSSGEQLKSLSNVEELETLLNNRQSEQDPAKKQGIQTQIDNFIIDLRPEILQQLQAELGSFKLGSFSEGRTRALVYIVAKARRKLAEAVVNDKKFVDSDKFTDDDREIMKRRVEVLALLDEEDMGRKGVQWSLLSVRSVEQQESAWAVKGGHRALREELVERGEGLFFEADAQDEKDRRKEAADKRIGQIDAAAGEWSDRRDAFETMRETYNERVKTLVKILVGAAVAAATLPGSVGVTWMAAGIYKCMIVLAGETVEAAVSYGLTREGMTRKAAIQQLLMTGLKFGLAASAATLAEYLTDAAIGDDSSKWLSGDAETYFSSGVKATADALISRVAFEGAAELFEDAITQEQVWENLRKNPQQTIADYMADLSSTALLTFVANLMNAVWQDKFNEEQEDIDQLKQKAEEGDLDALRKIMYVEQFEYSVEVGVDFLKDMGGALLAGPDAPEAQLKYGQYEASARWQWVSDAAKALLEVRVAQRLSAETKAAIDEVQSKPQELTNLKVELEELEGMTSSAQEALEKGDVSKASDMESKTDTLITQITALDDKDKEAQDAIKKHFKDTIESTIESSNLFENRCSLITPLAEAFFESLSKLEYLKDDKEQKYKQNDETLNKIGSQADENSPAGKIHKDVKERLDAISSKINQYGAETASLNNTLSEWYSLLDIFKVLKKNVSILETERDDESKDLGKKLKSRMNPQDIKMTLNSIVKHYDEIKSLHDKLGKTASLFAKHEKTPNELIEKMKKIDFSKFFPLAFATLRTASS